MYEVNAQTGGQFGIGPNDFQTLKSNLGWKSHGQQPVGDGAKKYIASSMR